MPSRLTMSTGPAMNMSEKWEICDGVVAMVWEGSEMKILTYIIVLINDFPRHQHPRENILQVKTT